MRWNRRLAVALAVLLAACGTVPVPADAASPTSELANSTCKVTAPNGWSGYALQWEGSCENGTAVGSGVLRGYAKDKPTLIFYGEMHGGSPSLGVVEQPDGYLAGQFKEGRVVPTDDPNVTLKAFTTAENAARLVARRFQTKGNVASARFYAAQAKRLGAQMD